MNRAKLAKAIVELGVFLLAWLVVTPLFADQGDPPARAGRLSVLEGNVSFQPSGEDQWSQATLNYTVTTGDRLYTDQGSRAEIEIGPFAVRMSEGTDLTFANLNDQVMQLGIGQGTIRVGVYELPRGNTFEIDTPNGALTALGPGSYRVDVDPNSGTLASVNEGGLQITGGGADQALRAGQAAQLTGTDQVQVTLVQLPARDGFDQWCASRDRRIRSFASRRYVSPYIPGAEDLDGYGRWEDVSDYGPVWYPAGVPGGWVPYRFGHWVWIEPWGWTWVEDEPWGFCPFHYGRWVFIGTAWAWVPGPVVVAPVYAPALVAFVGGGGFSVSIGIGWFPLGPREPFFPWYHHSDTYVREVNITNIRNVTNITNITNVTNINNIHYVNQSVATTAVPTEVFRSGQPVAPRAVRVAPQQAARAQVIPHPQVAPASIAAFGGKSPVKAPPVGTVRGATPPPALRTAPPSATRTEPSAPRAGAPTFPATRPAPQPPLVNRSTPPPRTEPGPPPRTEAAPPSRTAPPVITRSAPPVERRQVPIPPPPSAPPRVITRTPPPPRDVPFSAHQPALTQHPGRPLEPQQEQSVRAGRPAGPMRDREFPPHVSPPPRAAPPPPSRPAKNESPKPKHP
jgi:uncharacterized protein DUF6600